MWLVLRESWNRQFHLLFFFLIQTNSSLFYYAHNVAKSPTTRDDLITTVCRITSISFVHIYCAHAPHKSITTPNKSSNCVLDENCWSMLALLLYRTELLHYIYIYICSPTCSLYNNVPSAPCVCNPPVAIPRIENWLQEYRAECIRETVCAPTQNYDSRGAVILKLRAQFRLRGALCLQGTHIAIDLIEASRICICLR